MKRSLKNRTTQTTFESRLRKAALTFAWSPDGKRIAFRAYRDNQDLEVERPVGRAELYVMSPDGADVERLTRNAGWEGEARWSADSQWLVYRAGPVNADDPTLEGVYRMHVAAKKTVLIL